MKRTVKESTKRHDKNTERLLLSSYLNLKDKDKNSSISVTDICNNTTVNRGTFYLHHNSIEDFIAHLEDCCYGEIETVMETIYEQVHFTSEPLFDMIDKNRELFKYYTFYSNGTAKDKWTKNMLENIKLRSAKWKGVSNQQLELMVNFLIGGVETYFVNFYKNDFQNKQYLISSLDAIVTKGTRGINLLT